jgi:hypothetical protein
VTRSDLSPVGALPARFQPSAAWLQEFASGTPGVVAAYLGGSLATDRVDDDSDLDGQVMVETGRAPEVFDAMLSALRRDWQVTGLWLVPTPTWHGGIQLFATVARDDHPPLWVDLLVAEAGPRWLSVDERRHGRPVVLFDPEARVHLVPGDDAKLHAEALESARLVAERLDTAEWLVMKAVRRGHWPEAHAYHLRLGVEPAVQLLRTIHAPARWDFGLRYLDDLPEAEAARVLELLPEARERFGQQVQECFRWQRELLERVLSSGRPPHGASPTGP